MNTTLTKEQAKTIKAITNKFAQIGNGQFIGIREYTAKTSGEMANHVVNCNFSYENAVNHDIKALQGCNENDIETIAKQGFSTDLVKQAVSKLLESFLNNKNEDTRSNQSKGQLDAYIPVTNSIKLHIETGLLHIYALAVSKQILIEGTYKAVNSRELTLCQNAVKKHFDFKTTKYRNFIVSPEYLTGVNLQGEKFVLAE